MIQAMPSYWALRTDIESLLRDDDYDSDYQPPTQEAIRRVQDFLTRTLKYVQSEFPIASPVPDGVGGIRLYWMKPGKNLQLNVPHSAEQPLSLFFRDGRRHALDQGPSPARLAEQLAWFAGD